MHSFWKKLHRGVEKFPNEALSNLIKRILLINTCLPVEMYVHAPNNAQLQYIYVHVAHSFHLDGFLH